MAGEAGALSGLKELQGTTVSEEEMSEVNQTDKVVPELEVRGATQTGTIAIEEDAPASSAGRSATRLLEENKEMDAIVPEVGGPSTRTGTMAREGDELVADSRRLSEEGWRQTATTNIDASETGLGKRYFQGLWQGISRVSSAYSGVMRPPEEELLLSERDRVEIAASKIDFFFDRMARTGDRVVKDAPWLSEDFMTFGLAGEERVTKEENRLESLELKAKMASTLIDSLDFHYLFDEDRYARAKTKTKAEKEDMLARGSTLLQTTASKPALLDFEVGVPPLGFSRLDMTVMWSTCNFSTRMEPDNGASAETGEPSSPHSPRDPADEEATLARLINISPARPGGLTTATHMELGQDSEVALASLTNSPQRPGGLANATHMELSQNLVQALASMTISSSNAGLDEQQEQVQAQVNERSSPSADFDRAHFMGRRTRCRSRSRERYRSYSYSRGARRSLYTRRPQTRSQSPDRTWRVRSHSRNPSGSRSRDDTQIASSSSRPESPGRHALEADGFFSPGPVRRHRTRRARSHSRDPSKSRPWDPTQIASSSSRQESPCRRALEADGFYSPRGCYSPRPNRRRRALNPEFLDYCSSKEKVLSESD